MQKNENLIFNYKIDAATEAVVEGVRSKAQRLDELFFVFNGAKPYEVGKGIPPQTKEIQKNKIYNGYQKLDDTWIPYMRGKRIKRFTTMWNGEYIKYGENLAAPRSPEIFFREKIFVRQTGDTVIAQLDNGNVSNDTLHIVFSKDDRISNKYILGLLNSSLMSWYYQSIHPTEVGKPMAQVKKNFVEDLPIVLGSPDQADSLIRLVDDLLTLCQQRQSAKQLFIHFLSHAYEPKSISEKLENFDTISFKEFCSEMKKQKVKLSASQQMELLPLFTEKNTEISSISVKIEECQMQLDEIVYSIYDLDADCINRISNQIQIRI